MASVVDPARARPRSLTHRAAIRNAYLAATGHSKMDGRQLNHMEETEDYILPTALRGNVRATDDPSVLLLHRTWRQLSRGVGWAEKGMTVAEVHNRFKSQWHRTLDYLVVAGRIDGWAPIYEGRESTGVMIRIPAGVAQSVQATRSRQRVERRPSCSPAEPPQDSSGVRLPVGDPGPDPPFFEREDGTPPKGLGGDLRESRSTSSRNTRREARDARERRGPIDVRAALEAHRDLLDERGGAAVVRAVPWLAGVAPSVLAREACRVWWPELDPRLSAKWGAQLERSVEQLDRLGGRGAGAAMVLNLTGADGGQADPMLQDLLIGSKGRRPATFKWRDQRFPTVPVHTPLTLGAIAVAMRRWARRQAGFARDRKAGAGC